MSLFEKVEPVPPDPIFGLAARFRKDKRSNKIDLTLGVYKGKSLKIEILRSVKEAEKILIKMEKDKGYLPMGGDERFVQESQKLIFGEALCKTLKGKVFGAQTVGGTGALRLGGDFLAREVTKCVYVSDPTWPNHIGIFEAAGMEVKKYPYYNKETHALDFQKMLDYLSALPEKSLVVLHACCHNPTGCDPTQAEWKELSALLLKKKLIPFFDFAYQGFGRGLDEDAWAIRYFAEQGHEMFVAASYSKNFALYGERIGSLSILAKNEQVSQNLASVVRRIARVNYSNPPRHGGEIVATILQDLGLTKLWKGEVDQMRKRIEEMRSELIHALSGQFGKDKYGFLKRRSGLFSMLGLEGSQVDRMIEEYGVYLTRSGRINLTGLSEDNLPNILEAMIKTAS
ncbi:aromatic amino acid transaminase [Candidatus Neptunochlamydia vexilliferae]|uniref:Aminotransferase n=1 Tax=Candidatus Neptunichlamydia vexilliferae TaxID=1651774 RepID=A0ABS0AYU2_9BACT|nr:amino acid aminotransferase [Candidatus Neptunochlamydia vexilliferae]MBF5059292.1 Aspartate aminotransferase [Candidatus Neptunochlamydia vexilliferae]